MNPQEYSFERRFRYLNLSKYQIIQLGKKKDNPRQETHKSPYKVGTRPRDSVHDNIIYEIKDYHPAKQDAE